MNTLTQDKPPQEKSPETAFTETNTLTVTIVVAVPPSQNASAMSFAYPAIMELFTTKRLSRISIRTREGNRQTWPLILTAEDLVSFLPSKPKTEDEVIATEIALRLNSAVMWLRNSKHFREKSFFQDITREITAVLQSIREGKSELMVI